MSVLAIDNVRAGYGKITVLWDISLHVEEGELLTIIGANGAGKTTLLRAVSGLIPVTSGAITFRGKPLRHVSAANTVRLGLGHVPEGRQLFPLMTVKENLESGAEYVPHAKAAAAENRALTYELFPRLAEREKQLAGTLSGGERQMLAIGRALMTNPSVLLVDEPSLGLSPALALNVFQTLAKINEAGKTIVLVEQNVRQSLRIADRAYVLENGEMKKEGTGADLLHDTEVISAYLSL